MFMSGRPDGSGAGMPKKFSDSKDSRSGDAPGVQWEGHDVSSEDEDEHSGESDALLEDDSGDDSHVMGSIEQGMFSTSMLSSSSWLKSSDGNDAAPHVSLAGGTSG